MLQAMHRPNFFPGQLVDFRDFNRLSQQSDKTVSLLCQYLFNSGGVIVDALEEFQVVPMETGLSIQVRPGVALLPNGQAVCLTDDVIVDLTPYKNVSTEGPLVVALKYSVHGIDRYVDDADPSINGFRTEMISPEFSFSTEKAGPNTLELFRVCLEPQTQTLRLAEVTEGWNQAGLKSGKSEEAVIDLRFRPRIVPQTFVPLSTEQLIQLRKAFYEVEQAHRKIQQLYLVEDVTHSMAYLAQSHAEILSRPFQPLKVSFLVSEFADKFCRFLEGLIEQLGQQKAKYDQEALYATIAALEPFRVREVLPNWKPLDAFLEVSRLMNRFVDFAASNFSLATSVEEAQLDLVHRRVAFDDKMLLAGHLFERVDLITQETLEKWNLKTDDSHSRSVVTQFRNGDPLTLKGTFFKKGSVSVEMQIRHPDRFACVFLHQYIRRMGSSLHYEVNGKPLTAENSLFAPQPNTWINRGMVIPAEYLIAGKNVLRITVEKADLDFGFFDMAVYQASTTGEVQS